MDEFCLVDVSLFDFSHIALGPPHIPLGPSHIPRGVAEWNMRCGHEWMSFVEWMEPSLILFIYHVELSSASGISELYHDAK